MPDELCIESDDDMDVTPSKPGELIGEEEPIPEDTLDEGSGSDKVNRNYLDISQTAAASLRYGVSSTATAAICSGFLSDQIRGKIISQDKQYLVVDKKKVMRAKDRIMKQSQVDDELRNMEEVITGVFADGRKDKTRVLLCDRKTGRYHQRVVKQENISVTGEPDGRYLFHYTPEPPTRTSKPARQAAVALHEWMVQYGVDKTVLVIGGDSTNSNTGWKGGMLAHLEKLLGRKCYWVVCVLHTTELPLRHLFIIKDGKTNSKDGWTGPTGKLLMIINTIKRRTTFEPIPGLEPVIEIPQDIVQKMSTDSSVCYKLLGCIRAGTLDPCLVNVQCGALCHSRWLTFGEAIMLLYMSDHGLSGEVYRNFILIVKYVTQVYFPVWFDVKVKHSIVDGPYHILTLLRLVRQQSEEVREIVTPYIQTGAWFAHPEAILVSLLSSNDAADREFAVGQILQLRGDSDLGDMRKRDRVTPFLRMDATTLIGLIDWKKDTIHEPVFSCSLTKAELNQVLDAPLAIPYYPIHTQSTERAVKQVKHILVCVFCKISYM